MFSVNVQWEIFSNKCHMLYSLVITLSTLIFGGSREEFCKGNVVQFQ